MYGGVWWWAGDMVIPPLGFDADIAVSKIGFWGFFLVLVDWNFDWNLERVVLR